MNDTHKYISFFSEKQKRELLARLLQNKDFFPLSFAQQRLWFLNQLEPSSAFYNISHAIRLTGSLNVPALEQTLNEIVQRHEALRTSFMTVEGQPIQVIDPSLTISLPMVDLREFSEVEREAEVLRLTAEEAQQAFNLAKAPLLRATLLQLSEVEQVVLFTMHHIVSDDWSMKILIKEMAALYQAFNLGQPSPLVELPIQYADFAVWQQQWLQGEELQTQLSYWIQQLDAAPSIIKLPTDFPRPAIQNYQGAKQSIVLPKSLTQALKELSQQEGTTLFMTLLAAFKVLLYRYTQQHDILVGTPIANRNRPEIEGLIGFFVNTLVLRTDLGSNPSFRELLKRVRQVTLGAYAHQDLPFEYLVEKLQPKRDLSYSPVFQVMFALQNIRKDELKLPGVTLSFLQLEKQTAQFDLSIDFFETESGLSGWFEYNTDLFNASTISRMVDHFCNLLSDIVANPEQHTAELSLLTQSQQHQLLVEWNNTKVDYPGEYCIHQLFEAQVERLPDAIAVSFENQHLTYRELNHRANQLAHYLKSLGIKPEVLVGICVERSLEMAIGILGILKAGGAYVPLDPSYPQERLALILNDVKPLVLLTQKHLVTELPTSAAQVVCLDESDLYAQESQENPSSNVTAENLAYVIYTSGSTGTPKGVLISHQALVNHSIAAAKAYELQPEDRVLQFASVSFDVTAEELFPSWLSGSTVVIRPNQVLLFAHFGKFLAQEKLTVLNLPTAYWHEWVSDLVQTTTPLPPTLRLVIVGTEQALPEKLALWHKLVSDRSKSPRIRWLNAYGPTEATIGVTLFEPVEPVTYSENQPVYCVPVGRPIANTQVYLLDKHLQLTPVGVPGELYIGGIGIARGYLNHPELTAEKFIPNPFGKKSGMRLYRTGDLARYLPNGDIELLGRIDDQVKIRGFRIELGEISAKLQQYNKVREAVVIAREDEHGDKHLVAYVSPQPEQTLTITELRGFLQEKLPQYMMPSTFLILPTLPLLPNGKLDKRSLPAPEIRPELEATYVMPQTQMEQTIAGVWQKALNIDNIGVHDNFFELGGHSLLMVKVHSQLHEIFQTDLSMLDMFRYPTINSLAEFFSQTKNQTSSFSETNISIEKISIGKSQQKKRLQKIKLMMNNQGANEE
ncbi:non-ribosomal peptide synthetase [Nostoc sp. TCL240-02]|uniref:non-ribosomal peptide synthetase n=1 Tax=Nostoc sp. TCL240-02 TaxID=2572090 RepID=UPI00157F845D|nr:non-ribosomal peptide synthetase [Nostoc sp. TCL240-02]QKQ73081.1 amino acid adenylation domain-containing protein [Nostoc sp. TCL240-02]